MKRATVRGFLSPRSPLDRLERPGASLPGRGTSIERRPLPLPDFRPGRTADPLPLPGERAAGASAGPAGDDRWSVDSAAAGGAASSPVPLATKSTPVPCPTRIVAA